MNARQVNFPVHDLAAAIRFYSAMFASAPAVLEPDCAKWTLKEPRVSFRIYVRRVAVRGATPARLVAAVRETAKLQAGVA